MIKNKASFYKSLFFALEGLYVCIKTQLHMRVHIVAAVLAISMALMLKIQRIEWICLWGVIFLVLITESINTAIESTVDLLTKEFHPRAKVAKDVAAAAVLLASILAVIVGSLVLYNPLMTYIKGV
ncbi:MAG: diacylglycerol kinase family protein [bacterium]